MTDVEFICYCIAGFVIGAFCLGLWLGGMSVNDYRQGYEDGVNLKPSKLPTDFDIRYEIFTGEPISETYRRERSKHGRP